MADYDMDNAEDDKLEGPRAWCHVMYVLHGLSALGGVLTSATVVGAFITGWPSLLAVVINYMTRKRVAGTWLDSHWRWQLRTFWFAVFWAVLAMALFITLIGIPFAWALIVGTGLWVLYRVVRGWLVLLEGREIA